MKFLVSILFLTIGNYAFAKAELFQYIPSDSSQIIRKTYVASRVTTAPKIDGKPFETFWKNIPTGKDFTMVEPQNGKPERDTHRTEFKIAYDDDALYVAAYLYDNEPNRILTQFSQRDQINVQADIFGFFLNTYNNQINQTRFFATSGNALGDAISENGDEDFSYNVVFTSESSLDEKGWYVEMRIPYRALRFPEVENQDWSFQIFRRIKHLNEDYAYNYINITRGNSAQYDALLENVSNIDPPLRLNLYPFSTVIYNTQDGESTTDFNAGMDIKYGINDAFTLDATLIPDFGQVAFDAVQLNLGPFEQTFSENRAFFTEGTDLFRKGGLFFSRRIGQRPTGAGTIETTDRETIIENPENTKLLNSLKVTGRTKNGLGIGILNSITERTEAIVLDENTLATRKVVTEPLTNYNIVVLDQQYGENSSFFGISNASTLRNGSFTDANVTALYVDHSNKNNTGNYRAEAKTSNRFTPDGTDTGYAAEANYRRTAGTWRPRLGVFYADDEWNPNDLGLQFRNNFLNFLGDLSYVQLTQSGPFNRYQITLRNRYRTDARSGFRTNSSIQIDPFFVLKSRFAFGMDARYSFPEKDQFESRIDDLVVRYKGGFSTGGFVSSDYRKKFAYDLRAGYFIRPNGIQRNYDFRISPRYRFSDKLLMIYNFNWRKTDARNSFVTLDGDTPILSSRDTHSVENTLSGTYNFNNRQALSISFRNFWRRAFFSRDFKTVNRNGDLVDDDYVFEEDASPDVNFNIWNLDLSYRWRFAAGSEATILYRNSIFSQDNRGQIGFQDSLNDLFMQPVRHNISLRITYFIDVNNARRWFRKTA